MTLLALEAAIIKVRQEVLGKSMDEVEVSAGPVKRILAALGWDVFDVQTVKPEYNVGPGRVDFALKSAQARVDVFLEVKAPGQADSQADLQLFQYTVHQGIPLACLTDGRVWSIYLSGGQGSCEDRRLYRLDIVERDADQACQRLQRYLGRDNVATGKARQYALADCEDRARQQRLEAAVLRAWHGLLAEPDGVLCDLLIEAVERDTGERRQTDSVENFLRRLEKQQQPTKVLSVSATPPVPLRAASGGTDGIRYQFSEEAWQPQKDGKACYLALLRVLKSRHDDFPERFAKAGSGRKRAWIARTVEELFPGRPDFQRSECSDLGDGWRVGTQINAGDLDRRARVACAAVGLELGRDVTTRFNR